MSRFEYALTAVGVGIYAFAVHSVAVLHLGTVARWAGALFAAILVYVLMLLPIALAGNIVGAHSATVFAGGMAIATVAAALTAARIVQPRYRWSLVLACIALSLIYPALVAASAGQGAVVHGIEAFYLVATLAGGAFAVRLLRADAESISRHAFG